MKTAWNTEAKWKENVSQKGSRRGPAKATPASWRAFESNLETEAKWKEHVSKKGSRRGPQKATPASWRAFENSLEHRGEMEGKCVPKRPPKKTPKSHANLVKNV